MNIEAWLATRDWGAAAIVFVVSTVGYLVLETVARRRHWGRFG